MTMFGSSLRDFTICILVINGLFGIPNCSEAVHSLHIHEDQGYKTSLPPDITSMPSMLLYTSKSSNENVPFLNPDDLLNLNGNAKQKDVIITDNVDNENKNYDSNREGRVIAVRITSSVAVGRHKSVKLQPPKNNDYPVSIPEYVTESKYTNTPSTEKFIRATNEHYYNVASSNSHPVTVYPNDLSGANIDYIYQQRSRQGGSQTDDLFIPYQRSISQNSPKKKINVPQNYRLVYDQKEYPKDNFKDFSVSSDTSTENILSYIAPIRNSTERSDKINTDERGAFSQSYINYNSSNNRAISYSIVHDSIPSQIFSEQEKIYSEPEKVYSEPSKIYSDPSKIYGKPEIFYSEPSKIYSEPAKNYGEPSKIYGEPSKVYGEPAKIYSEPAKIYNEPEKYYSQPASLYLENKTTSQPENDLKTNYMEQPTYNKENLDNLSRYNGDKYDQMQYIMQDIYESSEPNYEVDEAVSVMTNGRTHGIQEEKTTTDSSKVGYVVEGRNYRKYRVEERTPDGFIVGEYGVLSSDDGTLRGVRYTADGTTNPRLIYDALMKFLSLK